MNRGYILYVALHLLTVSSAQVNLNDWLISGRGWQPAASNIYLAQTNTSQSGLLIEGFACLGLSVIGFGSSLVPVKSVDTGDGMFFQFVFCNTLALESLLVYVIRGCPDIWALSMAGGFLYALANLATVPIIKTIGLGMGFLIWSVFCLLMAWATARFGWFGLDKQDVPNSVLNYIGTALATISVLILFFIKTEEEQEVRSDEYDEERKPLLHSCSTDSDQLDSIDSEYVQSVDMNSHTSWTDKLSPVNKKIIGCSLATMAGLFYGGAYTPIIYIKNNSLKNATSFPEASQLDLDYLFSYTTGISALTSVAFFGYCVVMKNAPVLPSKCILPAFCAASMQFAAQCLFFTASYCLGTVITYPIGTTGPALVSLIWSIFYFKEIKGTKNLLILVAVVITVLSGVTLISLSRIKL